MNQSNVIPFRPAHVQQPGSDLVNHPKHYNAHPSGIECIDVIENLPGNLFNAVKYIWRQGEGKDSDSDPKANPINKARWYQQREKERRVAAMNQAIQDLQATGNAGGLVGQVGSLINTVDLLVNAIIIMGSTKEQLDAAAGRIPHVPPVHPSQLGAPVPNTTNRVWQEQAAEVSQKDRICAEVGKNAAESFENALFDRCHTGDECGPQGPCGTPGDPGLKDDNDLLDTENGDDRATDLGPPDSPSVPPQLQVLKAPDVVEDTFALSWNQLARAVHNNACRKGFWDKRQQLTAAVNNSCGAESPESGHVHDLIAAQCIALINTELGEATDALRAGNPYEQGLEGVRAVEAELADVVIRIMDTAAAFRWDVAGAIIKKTKFNASRPRMHGGKRF